jgi:hypothetical protein
VGAARLVTGSRRTEPPGQQHGYQPDRTLMKNTHLPVLRTGDGRQDQPPATGPTAMAKPTVAKPTVAPRMPEARPRSGPSNSSWISP